MKIHFFSKKTIYPEINNKTSFLLHNINPKNWFIKKNQTQTTKVTEVTEKTTNNKFSKQENLDIVLDFADLLKEKGSTEGIFRLSPIESEKEKEINQILKDKKVNISDNSDPSLFANILKKLFSENYISPIFKSTDLKNLNANHLKNINHFKSIVDEKIKTLKDYQKEIFKILLDLFKTVAEKQNKIQNGLNTKGLATVISTCFFGTLSIDINSLNKQNLFTEYLIENASSIINQIVEAQGELNFVETTTVNDEKIATDISKLLPENPINNKKYDQLINSRIKLKF